METELNLQRENRPRLWCFVGGNIAAFLAVRLTNHLNMGSVEHYWQRVSAKEGLIGLVMPLIVAVMNSYLDHDNKARLVFWRWTNPLPGCRAFTERMLADPRVDAKKLRQRLGELPKKPNEQNALWFSLYLKSQVSQRLKGTEAE